MLTLSFPVGGLPVLLDAILNIFFPCECVLCQAPALNWRFGPLCPGCLAGFRTPQDPLCSRCGSLDPTPGSMCPPCSTGQTRFDLARHALIFDEPVRMAVHHFKYDARVSLARSFGARLRACLEQHPFRARIAVPVPLHRKRERQRGYNQAALLARQIGFETRTDLLRRVRPTASQTGLTRKQRALNVRNAFECVRPVSGTVLVIDDVMTTGATIGEVVKVLRRGGASRVEVLTLTRVAQLETGA
jgi:ComF family protein